MYSRKYRAHLLSITNLKFYLNPHCLRQVAHHHHHCQFTYNIEGLNITLYFSKKNEDITDIVKGKNSAINIIL